MSGGFYMLEYLEEIEDFFVPARRSSASKGARTSSRNAGYYLDNETTTAIAQAGRHRALQDHTWQKRLGDAFQEMGLDHAAHPGCQW